MDGAKTALGHGCGFDARQARTEARAGQGILFGATERVPRTIEGRCRRTGEGYVVAGRPAQ